MTLPVFFPKMTVFGTPFEQPESIFYKKLQSLFGSAVQVVRNRMNSHVATSAQSNEVFKPIVHLVSDIR